MLPTLLFAIGAVSVLIALWPFGPYQLTLYEYIGHRLLRWIVGYFLIVAVLFCATATVLGIAPVMVFAVSGSLVLLPLAALRTRLRPAMTLLNVLLALAGNVVGVRRAVNGEPAIICEPSGIRPRA